MDSTMGADLDNWHPPFEYTPLRGAQPELRLLRFEPGNDHAIKCNIETFPLKVAPDYTALSYMWGDPSRIVTVSANTKELRITKSLEAFLLEILSRQKSCLDDQDWCHGWFWIDAISINQDDLPERSEQVTLMREIYESSRTLIIWLGEVPEHGEEAMKLLNIIASMDTDKADMIDDDTSSPIDSNADRKTTIEASYETLSVLSGLFHNPYWDRAWILQEASTPKSDEHTWVCYGNLDTTWNLYANANRLLIEAAWSNTFRKLIDLHAVPNSNIATVKYLEDKRRAMQMDNPLYPTMVRTRTSQATDPRDKLYSILGLVSEQHDIGLRPNYTLTVAEVYTRLAKTIISQTGSLDCLGSAGVSNDPLVPSWVPDWRIQHDEIPQPFYQQDQTWNRDGTVNSRTNLFNASGNIAMEIYFAQLRNQLDVRGMCFDTIRAASLPRLFPDTNIDKTWKDWVFIAEPYESVYIDGASRRAAFEKVLKADFEDVWGDWSAARGAAIDGYDGAVLNVFEFHDGIVDAMTWHRRLFTTSNGYMGIAPAHCKVGDTVAILFGSQMPVVLREQGSHWIFIGQAYIHGIMDGEAINRVDAEFHSQTFSII